MSMSKLTKEVMVIAGVAAAASGGYYIYSDRKMKQDQPDQKVTESNSPLPSKLKEQSKPFKQRKETTSIKKDETNTNPKECLFSLPTNQKDETKTFKEA